MPAVTAAIVDHGLGNLFSVQRACEHVGMTARVTARPAEIAEADVVILPGVGAFGDAMATLHRLDLVEVLRDLARAGKPLVGICLGIQLLMTESHEFGVHRGLGLVEGAVVPFPRETGRLKVPQVQWNRILHPEHGRADGDPWRGTALAGLPEGEFMYFCHSFHVRPEDPSVVLAVSRYGGVEFVSALRWGNVFACQFHPERSGPAGLQIYGNVARAARALRESAA
jgi:glutamine amidotransferase